MLEPRVEAFALAQRAIEILAGDDGDLAEAESCLLRALEVDPRSLGALQEAAHFFAAVNSDPAKARDYASRCRELAMKRVEEMNEILSQEES